MYKHTSIVNNPKRRHCNLQPHSLVDFCRHQQGWSGM